MNRYWLCRLYVCGSISVTALIALMDDGSRHFQSLSTDGLNGAGAVCYLLILCALGIYDVWREKFQGASWLPQIDHSRYFIYLGLSIGQACMILPNLVVGSTEPFILRYMLDSCFAAAVGILDFQLVWDGRRRIRT